MSAFRSPGHRSAALAVCVVLLDLAACSASPEVTRASSVAAGSASTPLTTRADSASREPSHPSTPTSTTGPTDAAGAPATSAAPRAAITPDEAASAPAPERLATDTGTLIGARTVRTKAIELRVEGVERVPEVGGRHARPGYEFVIVDTSWKNVIPLTAVNKKAQTGSPTGGFGGFGTSKATSTDPADIEMTPTPYVVPMLAKQMWLFTDGRFADTVDLEAEEAVADHFSKDGFGI